MWFDNGIEFELVAFFYKSQIKNWYIKCKAKQKYTKQLTFEQHKTSIYLLNSKLFEQVFVHIWISLFWLKMQCLLLWTKENEHYIYHFHWTTQLLLILLYKLYWKRIKINHLLSIESLIYRIPLCEWYTHNTHYWNEHWESIYIYIYTFNAKQHIINTEKTIHW